MATKAFPGFTGTMYLSTDAGTTLLPIAELQEVSLTLEMDEIEATSKDSAGWREFLPGLRRWGGSGKGLLMDVGSSSGATSTGQSEVWRTMLNREQTYGLFQGQSSSGRIVYKGAIIVTNAEAVDPLAEAAGLNFSFRGTAALSRVQSTS